MTAPEDFLLNENDFDPHTLHHHETIFTTGNGYLCTRGAFEEGYPGDRRATFIHGVFDDMPVAFTELANAPDWLPFTVHLDGERFGLDRGVVSAYQRSLDLRTGLLTRKLRWTSPGGRSATITLERFASMADQHLFYLRCQVTPEFNGVVEMRASLHGCMDNEGLSHWRWIDQGQQNGVVYLIDRTRSTNIDCASAMQLSAAAGEVLSQEFWDSDNNPTLVLRMAAQPGNLLAAEKKVAVATSRDDPEPLTIALDHLAAAGDWQSGLESNCAAWESEWSRSDVIVEGDEEAQIALRFNLFQLLIAAPRSDERVNIGAKTLSGFGYRGHAFWDTEIFMLPVFIYTAPHIARNLLNYRYHCLPGARRKAEHMGYEGAFFAWESAATGDDVTPVWLPDSRDRTRLVRIWTGDLALHISADIAYAAYHYWQLTGDDGWMVERGAELILDTARFWGSRAEWNAQTGHYEYNQVIGPDEYHDNVHNNAYTNRLAQWNLYSGLEILEWLRQRAPKKASQLVELLDLSDQRLAHWHEVAGKIHIRVEPDGLIEQFTGYFDLKPVDMASYEPRTRSFQEIFGVEGANEYQVIKQPDVVMLLNLLRSEYSLDQLRLNYQYYNPRTDLTYGSSLGPSIQAIVAARLGYPEEAYKHFILSARADLRDIRGNAGDGIHAASAGGTWQTVVFGFAGLEVTPTGWSVRPHLPPGWRRVAFKFFHRGQLQEVDIRPA